jgi:hypothetical protein
MLILIAFLFATTNMVPRLGSLTTFDRFLICCLALVFLALAESLITCYLVEHDGLERAKRLDHVSRIVFPAAFGLIIVAFLIP